MAKKVSKKFGESVLFEKAGDSVTGTVKDIRDRETVYGTCRFLSLVDENGELRSVALSSSLEQYEWQDLYAKKITISYLGKVLNPNSKRDYKDFEIVEHD